MYQETKAPPSILDQILEEMFRKLGEGDEFSAETIKELRNMANSNSLIKDNGLIDLLKQGDSDEDSGAGN